MSDSPTSVPYLSRSRKFVQRLIAGIVLLNLLALGMAAVMLQLSKERHHANAFVATSNLAQLLERDLSASFDKIDLVLLDIKDEVEHQLARDGLRPATLDNLMARQVFHLSELDTLRIANARGALIYGAGPAQQPPVNIADRAYFMRLRDEASVGLVVSGPVQSRITGQWTIVMGRRLNLPDGRFAGIVYAAITVERFRRVFAAINLGNKGAISLRDSELRLIARHAVTPGGDTVPGSQVVSRDLLRALEREPHVGAYLATTAMDGVERANAYRRISKYPFYILVGLATDDFLADWRTEVVKTMGFTLVFCLISLLLTGHIRKIWSEREGDLLMLAAQENSLRESEERFRLLVEGVRDYAIFMISPEGIVMNWNRGAENLQQWHSDEIVGRHFSIFYPPALIAAGMPEQHLATARELGRCQTEELRLRKDGSSFWASVTTTAVYDAAGHLRGFAKLTRNITEQKRNALQEQAHKAVLDGIVGGAPLPTILDVVVRGIEQQLPGSQCAVLLRDVFGTRLMMAAASWQLKGPPPFLDSLDASPADCCGAVIRRGERLMLTKPAAHDDCQSCRILAGLDNIAAVWAEPIRGDGNEILGVLLVCHTGFVPPGPFELGVLDHEAKLAGIAIARSRSNEAQALAASVYQAIGDAIVVTDAENRILGVNPAFTCLTGYLPEEIVGGTPHQLSSGRHDRAYFQGMWHALETTGRWQGEILNRHKDGHILTQWLMISTIYDARDNVERRVGLYSGITDHKRAEEAIWRQANYDPLTSLPNRRLFHDRLEQELTKARRATQPLALMLIDLDHFKAVNDTLGHDAGDQLLIEASRRIKACVRETDTVARLGGDEFTAIVTGGYVAERWSAMAQAIVDTLGQPFLINGQTAHIAGSVGIAVFPDDAQERSALLNQADQAMYAAKKAGRGCFRFFVHANTGS